MRPGTGGSYCWPLPTGNRGGVDLARDCPEATGLRGPRGSLLHVVQPSVYWGLSSSAIPKFYPTWNSLEVSGVSRLCPPTSYGFILEGSPISLTSHHCPLYRLTISVSPLQVPIFLCLPAPSPPSSCLLASVSSPACLGCRPVALPGCPPWLPLCGSKLAPPPAPLHPGLGSAFGYRG